MDFKTVLIKDSVINDITSEEIFAVQAGPAQSTFQQFPAVSSSNSTLTFNCQIPSESIVIDKNIQIATQLTLQFTINSGGAYPVIPAGYPVFNYGYSDALQMFPLNSLFTTTSATINNTTVSSNLQDILPLITRLNDNRHLYKYNSTTPTLPDNLFGAYTDCSPIGNNQGLIVPSSPLGSGLSGSCDEDINPRGSFPYKKLNVYHYLGAAALPVDNSVLSTGVAESWKIVLVVNIQEPLLALSPFTTNMCEFNQQGLMGVNNLSFVFQIDQSCKRVFSTGQTFQKAGVAVVPANIGGINPFIRSIQLGSDVGNVPAYAGGGATSYGQVPSVGFTNATMLLNFLTLQPTDIKESKNIVPYLDFPRYLSNPTTNGALLAGESASYTTNNIQLNQVPDLILMCVRIPMQNQGIGNTSSFLTVNSLSVNFNNSSGLLSSCVASDLWRISQKNGSQQTWEEFSGAFNSLVPPFIVNNFAPNAQLPVQAGGGNAGQSLVKASIGSLLVLSPAMNFSLPEWLSASSLGQYNFQATINVTNQYGFSIPNPEIVICCVNSGIMVTQNGVSSTFTGLLTKEAVLRARSEKPQSDMTSVQYERLVGGKLHHRGVSHLKNMYNSSNPHKMKGMGSMMSSEDYIGDGMSAGGFSAGAIHKKKGSKLHKYI
jgi:hypothetical protein